MRDNLIKVKQYAHFMQIMQIKLS